MNPSDVNREAAEIAKATTWFPVATAIIQPAASRSVNIIGETA